MSNRSARTPHEKEIEQIIKAAYRRELVRNADGSWFARIVEFPGCMTEGDTDVQALANLSDAMREWVRARLEDGDPIPPPFPGRPFSGKFVVRLTSTLHRQIAESATAEGVSLNAFVSSALAVAVGAQHAADGAGRRGRRDVPLQISAFFEPFLATVIDRSWADALPTQLMTPDADSIADQGALNAFRADREFMFS